MFLPRTFLAAASALVAILVTTGCQSSASTSDTAPPVQLSGKPKPAPTGADSITASGLRADVQWLASDELQGRETLQPGARRAAEFLAARFESLGLQPMPGQASFAMDYPLYEYGYDLEGTQLTLSADGSDTQLAAGVDYTPFPFSDSGTVDAQVVFAGYGITAPELEYDDYQGLEVEGKVVLVLRHHPNEQDDHSPFAETTHGYFTAKALNASKHGAIGMLLVTDPAHHTEMDDLRVQSLLTVQPIQQSAPAAGGRSGRRGAPAHTGRSHRGKQPPRPLFVAAQLSRSAAELLVAGSYDLRARQQLLDNGTRPAAMPLHHTSAHLTIAKREQPNKVIARNVAGFLPGSDPTLANEWIVIGAHYDHLGAYALGSEGDTTYNGADDNASGTAGMLSLAHAFATGAERPKRSLLFLGFSGEEKGLLGSRAMFEQQFLDPARVMFMLNLDMIGRNEQRPVEIVGDAYGTGLHAIVQAANSGVGVELEFGGTNYAGNSDHHPFYQQDIPFMFFFTGLHEDYHQLTDHTDKLAYDRMQQIVKVAHGVVERIASGRVTPTFVHHIMWLGIQVQAQAAGAVVTAVQPDSRAGRAGLLAGDVIVQFANVTVTDSKTIGASFRELEPGTSFTLGLQRGALQVEVSLERARRGFLGIVPGEVTADERKRHGLVQDEGVKLAGVAAGGPAESAGLRADDILIRIAGTKVGVRTLGRSLAQIGAGEKVLVVVVREGQRITLELILGERPR